MLYETDGSLTDCGAHLDACAQNLLLGTLLTKTGSLPVDRCVVLGSCRVIGFSTVFREVVVQVLTEIR